MSVRNLSSRISWIASLSMLILCSCTYIVNYDVVKKEGGIPFHIYNQNGVGIDSMARPVYRIIIESDSGFVSRIGNDISGRADLIINDSHYTASVVKGYDKQRAYADIHGFPKDFDPLKGQKHTVELFFGGSGSARYYALFQSK